MIIYQPFRILFVPRPYHQDIFIADARSGCMGKTSIFILYYFLFGLILFFPLLNALIFVETQTPRCTCRHTLSPFHEWNPITRLYMYFPGCIQSSETHLRIPTVAVKPIHKISYGHCTLCQHTSSRFCHLTTMKSQKLTRGEKVRISNKDVDWYSWFGDD